MPIDIETRNQDDLTAVTVTVKLDPETCLNLSVAFRELGEALYAAQSTYKARRSFKAEEPYRKALQDHRRASVASRLRELKDLPPRKAVSVIAREFELNYDMTDFLVADIRRAERREAALERDRLVMQLSKSGSKATAIAERLGLAPGTVRNILSRLRGPSARRAASKSQAA